MNLEFSKYSWHARLYNFVYDEEVPESLCNYFWQLVLIIPILILFFPFGLLIRSSCPQSGFGGTLATIVMNLALTTITSILITVLFILPFYQIYLPAIIVLSIGGFMVLFYLITAKFLPFISKSWKEYRYGKFVANGYIQPEKKPNLVVEYYKAFKGKYCPKITWKNY